MVDDPSPLAGGDGHRDPLPGEAPADVVAGVLDDDRAAAVFASAFPTYTGAQIVAPLRESAVDLGPVGYDYLYGAGRLLLTRATGRVFVPVVVRNSIVTR